MKVKNSLFLFIALLSMLFSCSKNDDNLIEPIEEPVEEPVEYKDEAHWVPKRSKLVREVNYKYTQILPDADGKYPPSRTDLKEGEYEIRDGKGYVFFDEKYRVVYVVDWPTSATHGSTQARPIYFNFDTRDTVSVEDAQNKKADWHISHQDIYNAYIYSNATTAHTQPGLGKIRIVATPFDQLNEAPETPMIVNYIPIEMSENDQMGWGWYRLSDHILRPYKDRSLILQLQDGRYVKYQLVNLYRTNPTEVKDKYQEPAPFLNFRYFIQQTPNNRNLKTSD